MTRLLLDTCAYYWWDRGTDITDEARHAVENANETFVSAASAWEIMTKWRSGKQPEFAGLANTFVKVIEAHGFKQLPISVEHALQAAESAVVSSRSLRPDADRPKLDGDHADRHPGVMFD